MNFPEKAYLDNAHTSCAGPHGVPPVICVKRDETGYWPVYTRLTAAQLNEPLGVTTEVAEQMLICSMFGWNAAEAFVEAKLDHLWTNHFPKWNQNPHHVEYVGPITLWKGKTALAMPLVAVQMDDRGQYMAHGWHLFNASDWKVPETRPLYKVLASSTVAHKNCLEKCNLEWIENWEGFMMYLIQEHMPSGSGFDRGTRFDFDASSADKLVFHTSFHHLNDNGVYDGWTEHQVIVTPSLAYGFNVRVTGPNRNDIREYIAETFHQALSVKVKPYAAS